MKAIITLLFLSVLSSLIYAQAVSDGVQVSKTEYDQKLQIASSYNFHFQSTGTESERINNQGENKVERKQNDLILHSDGEISTIVFTTKDNGLAFEFLGKTKTGDFVIYQPGYIGGMDEIYLYNSVTGLFIKSSNSYGEFYYTYYKDDVQESCVLITNSADNAATIKMVDYWGNSRTFLLCGSGICNNKHYDFMSGSIQYAFRCEDTIYVKMSIYDCSASGDPVYFKINL